MPASKKGRPGMVSSVKEDPLFFAKTHQISETALAENTGDRSDGGTPFRRNFS
jgi:hypothetical protein